MVNEALMRPGEEALSTLDVMTNLDDRQRARYVAFQETFESSGWPLVIEWAQVKTLEAMQEASVAPTWEQTLIARGRRQVWEEIQNLATMFMNEFALVAQQNAEAQEVDEEVDLIDFPQYLEDEQADE